MSEESDGQYTGVKDGKKIDDGRFKTFVRDSKILPMILQSNIDELKDKSVEEILSYLEIGKDGRTVIGKPTEFTDPNEGTIRVDSVFEVNIPDSDETISVLVNIEGQDNPKPKYPLERRAEYYIARLVSSQKGILFDNDDYGRMRKTYSIWYILDPRVDDRNTITRYSMKPENVYGKERRHLQLDTFNIIFVNVGRYDSSLPDPMAFVSILFKLPEDERNIVMKDRFNIEIDDVLNRELREMASIWQDNYDKGFDQGMEKGMEKGMEEKLFEIVSSLVKEKGWSIEEALSLSSDSEEVKESVRRRIIEGS